MTRRPWGEDASVDDELVAALFEISRAHTMVQGVFEALPPQLQLYGSEATQLLDRATARLRWVHLNSGAIPPARTPDDES